VVVVVVVVVVVGAAVVVTIVVVVPHTLVKRTASAITYPSAPALEICTPAPTIPAPAVKPYSPSI
jgi:hypothetical protein